MIRLTGNDKCEKLTNRQKEVYKMLSNVDCASVKEVSYYTGAAKRTIDELVKKGAAEYFEDEIFRIPYKNIKLNKLNGNKLTPRQKVAHENIKLKISEHKACVSLLYGVTGSGKTSVFMKLIDDVTGNGREVILMVPEIALTTQMIKLFKEKYGDKVSVFHSGLSMGERLDEYKRVREGKANIVIGTRSAVFAPFKNLGLIIMDEEQEYTYKSESTPRFNARDIAKFRADFNKCMLLLASATPSLESYYAAKSGIYSLNILCERYG
jgi:primosomal protein N' (replication factor Y)